MDLCNFCVWAGRPRGCVTNSVMLTKVQCMDFSWLWADALVTSLWIVVTPEFIHKPTPGLAKGPSSSVSAECLMTALPKLLTVVVDSGRGSFARLSAQGLAGHCYQKQTITSLTSPPSQVFSQGKKRSQWKGPVWPSKSKTERCNQIGAEVQMLGTDAFWKPGHALLETQLCTRALENWKGKKKKSGLVENWFWKVTKLPAQPSCQSLPESLVGWTSNSEGIIHLSTIGDLGLFLYFCSPGAKGRNKKKPHSSLRDERFTKCSQTGGGALLSILQGLLGSMTMPWYSNGKRGICFYNMTFARQLRWRACVL